MKEIEVYIKAVDLLRFNKGFPVVCKLGEDSKFVKVIVRYDKVKFTDAGYYFWIEKLKRKGRKKKHEKE